MLTSKRKAVTQQRNLAASVTTKRLKRDKQTGIITIDTELPLAGFTLVRCAKEGIYRVSPGSVTYSTSVKCSNNAQPFHVSDGVMYGGSLYCSTACAAVMAKIHDETSAAKRAEKTAVVPEGWRERRPILPQPCGSCNWPSRDRLFYLIRNGEPIGSDLCCVVCMRDKIQRTLYAKSAVEKYAVDKPILVGWERRDMDEVRRNRAWVECHSAGKGCVGSALRPITMLFKHTVYKWANPGACAVCMETDEDQYGATGFDSYVKAMLLEGNYITVEVVLLLVRSYMTTAAVPYTTTSQQF